MRGPASFTITTLAGPDAVVLARGELDLATAPALRIAVLDCLGEGAATIGVDMRAVSFIDCSGINAMLDIRRAASRTGSTVSLINPSDGVLRVVRLTQTGTLLAA